MNIKILGTAAAEGIPSPFCSCRFCEYSRKHLKLEQRKRSSVLIDKILLIDMGPDTLWNSVSQNISYNRLRFILFSHSHFDHFSVPSLLLNSNAYRKKRIEEPIKLVGSPQVYRKLINYLDIMAIDKKDFFSNYHYTVVKPGEELMLGKYIITILESTHSRTEKCLLYVIRNEEKSFFYSTDTAMYNVQEVFKNYSDKLDVVLSDCTYGINSQSVRKKRHMGLIDNIKIFNEMKTNNLLKETSRYILTHFSHDSMIPNYLLKDYAKRYNMEIAYDGMEVNI